MSTQTSLNFRANATKAIADASLRASMKNAADTFGAKRASAVAGVPDFEALREKASAIRMGVLDDLKTYVDRFSQNAAKAGATVHHAKDAAAARETIAES